LFYKKNKSSASPYFTDFQEAKKNPYTFLIHFLYLYRDIFSNIYRSDDFKSS